MGHFIEILKRLPHYLSPDNNVSELLLPKEVTDFRNDNRALSFTWGWESMGWERLRMLKNVIIGNQ